MKTALYAASACGEELFGLAELFKELHYKISVRLEMDFDSARQALLRRGPGGLKHIEIRCLAIQQWIREERLSLGRVDTKSNTAHLVTFFRGTTNAGNFGFIPLEARTTESFTSALPLEQVCEYPHVSTGDRVYTTQTQTHEH